MQVLFFDTETTGKPLNYKAPVTDLNNWPRVIQLGWQVADFETGNLLHQKEVLIKPDGWEIPVENFWIKNGFSTDVNRLEGLPMPEVLEEFIYWLDQSEVLVAHNLGFDNPVLGAEMIRYKVVPQPMPTRRKVCTMESTIELCKIPFGKDRRPWMNKSYKFPKLEELYKHLFKKGFEEAHQASNDVTATRECFFELVKRQHIKI